jgi:ketosteroid isomerase-like protein
MSTQTTFDLSGLSKAIQSGDCRYQLALFADDAEVKIVDGTQPTAPLGVLRGKPAIEKWLATMSSRAAQFRVRDAIASRDRVHYTEECRYRDGSELLFEYSAEVRRGQISRADVTVVHAPESAPDSGTVLVDIGPTGPEDRRSQVSGVHLLSSASGVRSRSLPGYFLG